MSRRGASTLCAVLVAFAAWCLARPAEAHQVDAAFLALTEVASGRFSVKWQAGSPSLRDALTRSVEFPAACRLEGATLDCGSSELMGTIAFPWLAGTSDHVMVEIEWRDHTRLLRSLTGEASRMIVYGAPASRGFGFVLPVASDYTKLGVEHILSGFDHLLFVIALTLLVRGGKSLIVTVTAFTLAHSFSLAATVFGLVSLPAPPVEATIALSIVLVCAEAVGPADSLTRRFPWLVAFAFGLLHGLGFASALLEIGLPQAHVPLALLFFNVGVELGQLGVIAAVLGLGLLVRRARVRQMWLRSGLLYAMGSVAAAWSLERIAAVFGR